MSKRSNPYVSVTRDYKKSRFEPVSAMYARRAYLSRPLYKATGKDGRVKSLIKKALSRAEETKVACWTNELTYTSSTGNTLVQFPIAPTSTANYGLIAQGTGAGDRIGNKIRVKKAIFKGVVYPYPYDATNNTAPRPHDVRMIIAKNKYQPQVAPPLTSQYETGDSYNAAIGQLQDIVQTLNRDTWKVYDDRVYKIGNASDNGTGAAITQQYYNNNDYKLNQMFSIDITHMLPSTIEWNTTVGLPVSPGLFCTMVPAACDGTNYGPNDMGVIWYSVEIRYVDA